MRKESMEDMLREYAQRNGTPTDLQVLLYGAADSIEHHKFTQANMMRNMDSLHSQIAVLRESLTTRNEPEIPDSWCSGPCWCDKCRARFEANQSQEPPQ